MSKCWSKWPRTASKMMCNAIMLKPHVLTHIFQEPIHFVFMENKVHVTGEIRWKKVWSYNMIIQEPCPHVDTVLLKNLWDIAQCTVSSRSGRVQHVTWRYFVCSREVVYFRTWVPMLNLTVLFPTSRLQSL